MAQVVYGDVQGSNSLQGTLFQGQKFWLSAKVPSKLHFIDAINANGGKVVASEKHADVLIVDHARRDVAPGSHSYRFIEQSIRKGRLENLDDHRAGPIVGTVRSVACVSSAPKTTRTTYTPEDERILLGWVRKGAEEGAKLRGNTLFMSLERVHPRHTWQSWRAHWVQMSSRDPTLLRGYGQNIVQISTNAPPTPPNERPTHVAGRHDPAQGGSQVNVSEAQQEAAGTRIVERPGRLGGAEKQRAEGSGTQEEEGRFGKEMKKAQRADNIHAVEEAERSQRGEDMITADQAEDPFDPFTSEEDEQQLMENTMIAEDSEGPQHVNDAPAAEEVDESAHAAEFEFDETMNEAEALWIPLIIGNDWDPLSEDDVAGLLARTPDILELPPESEMDAWISWAELFPHRTADEWRRHWKSKVLPFYKANAVAVGLAKNTGSSPKEGNMDSTAKESKDEGHDISETSRRGRSPSYRPESPLFVSKPSSATKTPPLNAFSQRTEGLMDLYDLSDAQTRNLKRKRDLQVVVPDSSPPTSTTIKRSRLQRHHHDSVASIPMSGPAISQSDFGKPFQVMGSDQDPDYFERDKNGHNDDEDEEEIRNNRGASETLSEPDTQRRVDAQIFSDLGSGALEDLNPITEELNWRFESMSSEPEVAETQYGDGDMLPTVANRARPRAFASSSSPPELSMRQRQIGQMLPSASTESLTTLGSQTPQLSSAPQSPKHSLGEASFEEWLKKCTNDGFAEDDAEKAIMASSMDFVLADKVLARQRKEGRFPTNMKGVWTEEDDDCLNGSNDARKIRMVIKKHGQRGCDERHEFLREYEES